MSVRDTAIFCPDCKERVVSGTLVDGNEVFELKLSDSVLSAKRLYSEIGVHAFIDAQNAIVHSESADGKVQHTID